MEHEDDQDRPVTGADAACGRAVSSEVGPEEQVMALFDQGRRRSVDAGLEAPTPACAPGPGSIGCTATEMPCLGHG